MTDDEKAMDDAKRIMARMLGTPPQSHVDRKPKAKEAKSAPIPKRGKQQD